MCFCLKADVSMRFRRLKMTSAFSILNRALFSSPIYPEKGDLHFRDLFESLRCNQVSRFSDDDRRKRIKKVYVLKPTETLV